EPHAKGDVAVRVRGLRLHRDSPEISFDIRRGEILGVAGMVGSGRTEMARAIFGADRRYSGGVEVLGRQADLSSPRRSIRSDLAFVSEDRQRQGLALDMSVLENLLQVSMNKTPGLLFSGKKSWKLARPRFEQVGVRGCGPLTPARQLSGGNQQKVVLGKWLMVDSQFMIFDEPTRGIDVNAKSEIYGIIVGLAKAGKSILMISSDMPELIALSDRILVMRKGRVTGEIQGEDISEQEIIKKALEVEV
ncbi:MAG: sugar ABC transporter ATP-binding protein, partial [Clostridiales bacterium]|nr:sugar ABC transporter ATP-binding protein [Clostridiales bacterium]